MVLPPGTEGTPPTSGASAAGETHAEHGANHVGGVGGRDVEHPSVRLGLGGGSYSRRRRTPSGPRSTVPASSNRGSRTGVTGEPLSRPVLIPWRRLGTIHHASDGLPECPDRAPLHPEWIALPRKRSCLRRTLVSCTSDRKDPRELLLGGRYGSDAL